MVSTIRYRMFMCKSGRRRGHATRVGGLCGEAGDGHHRGLVAYLAEQAGCCDHVAGDVHSVAALASGTIAPGGAGQVERTGLAGEAELAPPGLAVAPAGVGGVEEGFQAATAWLRSSPGRMPAWDWIRLSPGGATLGSGML